MAADKVVEDKKPAPSFLPVTVAEKEEAPSLPDDDVLLVVSLWALLTAGIFLTYGALGYAFNLHIPPSSWMTGGPKLTAAEERALRHGVLWNSAAVAAVAELALLLPGRHSRTRRALAYVALMDTAATHIAMLARAVTLLLTAELGGIIIFWIFALLGTVVILIMAAGDILCFLALVLL